MGPIAARKARSVVEQCARVLAIEILAACQALDFLSPLRPGRGARAAYETVRRAVPFMERDRVLAEDHPQGRSADPGRLPARRRRGAGGRLR